MSILIVLAAIFVGIVIFAFESVRTLCNSIKVFFKDLADTFLKS